MNTKNIAHPQWPSHELSFDLAQKTVSLGQIKSAPQPTLAQAQALFQKEYDRQRYMIDGRRMCFQQFLDEVAPEPGAQRTWLTLKYSAQDSGS